MSESWTGVWNRAGQLIAKLKEPTSADIYVFLRMGFTVGPVSADAPLVGEPCSHCGRRETYVSAFPNRLPGDDIDERESAAGSGRTFR